MPAKRWTWPVDALKRRMQLQPAQRSWEVEDVGVRGAAEHETGDALGARGPCSHNMQAAAQVLGILCTQSCMGA